DRTRPGGASPRRGEDGAAGDVRGAAPRAAGDALAAPGPAGGHGGALPVRAAVLLRQSRGPPEYVASAGGDDGARGAGRDGACVRRSRDGGAAGAGGVRPAAPASAPGPRRGGGAAVRRWRGPLAVALAAGLVAIAVPDTAAANGSTQRETQGRARGGARGALARRPGGDDRPGASADGGEQGGWRATPPGGQSRDGSDRVPHESGLDGRPCRRARPREISREARERDGGPVN